jgi:beta-glucanase (GH16 family)
LPDLQDVTRPIVTGKPPPNNRRWLLIGGLVALALVATLVIVLIQPTTTQRPEPGQASPAPAPEPAGWDTSAAKLLGWGEPNAVEDFDGPLGPEWRVYDGAGHVGNGIRSPEAVTVDDGELTITGDSEGTTGGMAWLPSDDHGGQKYGRWEGRVKAPESDETYNALLLLWPDAENWPIGGEIDFMEMLDPTRQQTEIFIHYGAEDYKINDKVQVDGTEWHNWAVEWTPEHIVAYLDGREWFRTSDTEVFPPDAMHLCIQLDWFPDQGDRNDVQESTMQVDWVRQYPYNP